MTLAVARDVASLLKPVGNRVENLSLLFNKLLLPDNYADRGSSKASQKEEALRRLTDTPPRLEYQRRTRTFFQMIHQQYRENALMVVGKLESRLAVNLADGLLENAGIALDRLLGAPYIPGSAVKGCCAHAAREMVKKGALQNEILPFIFGSGSDDSDATRGRVIFLPALPWNEIRIGLDILNPHHDPNTGKERDPVPVKFPVVETGGRFLFSLLLPEETDSVNGLRRENFQEMMHKILLEAFDFGLGAKTAAGHGWFSEDPDILNDFVSDIEREEQDARAAREKAKLEQEAQAARERAKQEEEQRREENALKKKREEAEELARIASLSPEDQRREELARLSNKEFEKKLGAIRAVGPEDQRLLLEVAKTKNRYPRLLKDRRIGPRMKEVAENLEIAL